MLICTAQCESIQTSTTLRVTLSKALLRVVAFLVDDSLAVKDLHRPQVEDDEESGVRQVTQRVLGHVQLGQVSQLLQFGYLRQLDTTTATH